MVLKKLSRSPIGPLVVAAAVTVSWSAVVGNAVLIAVAIMPASCTAIAMRAVTCAGHDATIVGMVLVESVVSEVVMVLKKLSRSPIGPVSVSAAMTLAPALPAVGATAAAFLVAALPFVWGNALLIAAATTLESFAASPMIVVTFAFQPAASPGTLVPSCASDVVMLSRKLTRSPIGPVSASADLMFFAVLPPRPWSTDDIALVIATATAVASATGDAAWSEMPFAIPPMRFAPISANTVDGERTPRTFLAAFLTALAALTTAFSAALTSDVIPLMSPWMSASPALTSKLPRSPSAESILPGSEPTRPSTPLMPPETAPVIADQADETAPVIALQADDIARSTAPTAAETTPVIVAQATDIAPLMALHPVVTIDSRRLTSVRTRPSTKVTAVCTTVVMVVQTTLTAV